VRRGAHVKVIGGDAPERQRYPGSLSRLARAMAGWWRGKEPYAQSCGCDIGLLKRTYANPRPEVEVLDLEFRSALSPCAPALMAITVE